MTTFSDAIDFYPTPPALLSRMMAKIKGNPRVILEPSAGKGTIVEKLEERYRFARVLAVEKDQELQTLLFGKGIKVVDTDFMGYSGLDKFDLIIANPPFSNGAAHLLRMIDIMYRGQIICVLNAETLRNPCTNDRKVLMRKLQELNADVTYMSETFADAERRTNVDIALIDIQVHNEIERDLFETATDEVQPFDGKVETQQEISRGESVEELVAEYDRVSDLCIKTIVNYYRNYKKVGQFVKLVVDDRERNMHRSSDGDLTTLMQSTVNETVAEVRRAFWRKLMEHSEVSKRLTEKRRSEFNEAVSKRTTLDFTLSNINNFIEQLVVNYGETIQEAVIEIFDTMTRRHAFDRGEFEKNIHYFNGWKTNSSFKVGRKVVLPIYASYGAPFVDGFSGKWKLDYQAAARLDDIDKVMAYFDPDGLQFSIADALRTAFAEGDNKAQSQYFDVVAYKKGTVHLTFRDEAILRRFNVAACAGLNWLPNDYGRATYEGMSPDERAVVDSFEGRKSYEANIGKPVFANHSQNVFRLTAESEAA